MPFLDQAFSVVSSDAPLAQIPWCVCIFNCAEFHVDSLLSTAAKHSTFYLVKVSFDLVRQLRLRSPLLPRRVPSQHFGHPLVGRKRAQFEALHEEEILKLDLEIHSIRIVRDRFQAVRVAETCRPCKTEHQIRGRITMNS